MSFFELVAIVVGLGILCGMFETFLRHRREMAKIVHKGSGKSSDRVEALERKVAELTEIIHDQTLALENLRPSIPKDIEDRLKLRG